MHRVYMGCVVMHGLGIFVHVRSMILYYCSINQFILLAKANYVSFPSTYETHLPDFVGAEIQS